MSHNGPQATGPGRMRTSAREREATVAVLRDAYSAGRLTLGELRDRAGAAYTAKTRAELREQVVDLGPWPHPPDTVADIEVEEVYRARVLPDRGPRLSFTPIWIMVYACLSIAAAAFLPLASIALVPLALLGLWVALSTRPPTGRSGRLAGPSSTAGSVDGLLGSDELRHFGAVTIDFSRQRLRLARS